MSFEDLLKLADGGDADAQYKIGHYYDAHKDYTRSFNYYQLSANKKHPDALNYLGWKYQHGYGVNQNDDKAFTYYLLSVEQKNIVGYANVAYCYEMGRGVTKDLKIALEYHHLYGDKNYIDNCEFLILKQFSETLNETDYLYAYPLYIKHNHKDLDKLKTLINKKYIEAMHFMPSVLSDIIISFLL